MKVRLIPSGEIAEMDPYRAAMKVRNHEAAYLEEGTETATAPAGETGAQPANAPGVNAPRKGSGKGRKK